MEQQNREKLSDKAFARLIFKPKGLKMTRALSVKNDLIGARFGRLTVVSLSDRRGKRGARTVPLWECRCDCGEICYKATDTLKRAALSMCRECSEKYASEKMRENAGYTGGTQISKIRCEDSYDEELGTCRGVNFDKNTGKWRVRLKFRGVSYHLGSYEKFEEAVRVRKEAEREYYGEFLSEIEGK